MTCFVSKFNGREKKRRENEIVYRNSQGTQTYTAHYVPPTHRNAYMNVAIAHQFIAVIWLTSVFLLLSTTVSSVFIHDARSWAASFINAVKTA